MHLKDRVRRAQASMSEYGVNALLITTGTNLAFLSGFDNQSLARPNFLLIPQDGSPTLLVQEGRQFEARRSTGLADIRTYHELSIAPIAELGHLLEEMGVRRGRIGMELGYEQRLGLPITEFERMREELSPASFVDAADLLWGLRMIKSEEDIEAHRRACKLTDTAYAQVFASVGLGITEQEAARRLQSALLSESDGAWIAVTSGSGNYDALMGRGTDRTLAQGDMLWFDSGCRINGFWSDYGRGGVIGGPSHDQIDLQYQINRITMEGVAMVRPGAPVSEIASHCNAAVAALNIPITSCVSGLAGRVGHGIGFEVTEPPHVSEEDTTLLQPGMIITIEPGVATEFGIFHIEQNVLVTDDGHELLSHAPWELQSL